MCTQSDRYQSGGRKRRRQADFLGVTLVMTILLVLVVIDDVSCIRRSSKSSKSSFDYCSAGLCPTGTSHVACGGLKFGSDCQRPILIKMTPKYVNLILNYHNLKRNALACGSMKRFASASSMQKLVSFFLVKFSSKVPTMNLLLTALERRTRTFGRIQRKKLPVCP